MEKICSNPNRWGSQSILQWKRGQHEQGVAFLLNKDIVKNLIGCRPVSSRSMKVRLRANSFNITSIQVYAPTSVYDDSEVEF